MACKWPGVTCSETGSVIALTSNYAVAGNLPTEIGQLSALTSINFYLSLLTGTIPSSIQNCPLQMMFIRSNGKASVLSGTIPSLPSTLTYLDLSQNDLTGTIPSFPLGLYLINLTQNSLSGTIPSLPRLLNYLYLSQNSLSGTIPPFLFNLFKLDLSQNYLTGTIPSLPP